MRRGTTRIRRVSHRLRLRALPFWLSSQLNDRSALIILGIAVLVITALVLLAPLAISNSPLPTDRVEGRIVGTGFVDILGRGSIPEASVEVEGRTLRVEVPARLNCRIGDRVALDRVTTRRGRYFLLAPIPDPCERLYGR